MLENYFVLLLYFNILITHTNTKWFFKKTTRVYSRGGYPPAGHTPTDTPTPGHTHPLGHIHPLQRYPPLGHTRPLTCHRPASEGIWHQGCNQEYPPNHPLWIMRHLWKHYLTPNFVGGRYLTISINLSFTEQMVTKSIFWNDLLMYRS